MGCFSTCFNTCKPSRRRRRRSLKTHHPSLLHHLENYQSIDDFQVPQLIEEQREEEEREQEQEREREEKVDSPIELSPVANTDEKTEKQNSSGKKKVRFDLNVKFYETLTRNEEADEDEINVEDGEMDEEEEEDDEEEEEEDEQIPKEEVKAKSCLQCQCSSDSNSSSLFSYPRNHRYQNIRDSDDEMLSSDESDEDYYTDEDDSGNEDESVVDKTEITEEQSSESLFSLTLDSRKIKLGTVGCDKEVNSPMPNKNEPQNDSSSRYDRAKYVDSVLNPVENLTQWKDIKARSKLVSKDQPPKENVNAVQDFSFPVKNETVQSQKEIARSKLVSKDQPPKENVNAVQDFSFPVKNETVQNQKEIAVDTSLSTWLVGSEQGKLKRSNSRNSAASVGNLQSDSKKVVPNKFQDRPILGALTLEEIRQMSAASTPRKSPNRSPEDVPIIGSVGSYWSHTGQGTKSGGSSTKSTKSRYRESAEVIWDSTPFETRLEKALEKEANAEGVFAV